MPYLMTCTVRTPRPRFLVAATWVALCLAAPVATAQSFNQTFRVTPQSCSLEVSGHAGSIKVTAGEGNHIVVRAREKDEKVRITAIEIKPSQIKVEVIGSGKVKLEITVPSSANLDLLCYECELKTKNISGSIIAKSTEGDIEIKGGRSPRVEAYTTTGDVLFDSETLPSGSYTLKSLSGSVTLVLPAVPDLKLSATSFRGGIGLGDFQWKFTRQTDQFVEASQGDGRASVHLLTKEGNIQIHRRQ
jgi:DUF4097 and DUF4098 domain-containing protein YvlB